MSFKPSSKLFHSDKLTNRRLWEVLPDNSWKGKPCFVIGGGPSLEKFKWKNLKGHRTIGCNRAYEVMEPTIIFSMDNRFLLWVRSERYGMDAKKRFDETPAYKVWLTTYPVALPDDIFIVPVYGNYDKGHTAFTSSMKEGLGHGNSSGYGALNLAFVLGANPIYLLGYDMNHKPQVDERGMASKKSHWHTGHPMPQYEDTVIKFRQAFVRAAPIIEEAGVKVINLNPNSGLDCFEKRSPESVFN